MNKRLNILIEKYNKILSNYVFLDQEIENYKEYKRKEIIINNVISARRNINNPEEYKKAIEAYEKEFNETYNVFKIKKLKFKTNINYQKIDYSVLERLKKDLLNLAIDNVEVNVSKVYKDFERKVIAINAKIELLNYESLNNSTNDFNKFLFEEMKKSSNTELNLLKKVNEKNKIKAIDRKNARKNSYYVSNLTKNKK